MKAALLCWTRPYAVALLACAVATTNAQILVHEKTWSYQFTATLGLRGSPQEFEHSHSECFEFQDYHYAIHEFPLRVNGYLGAEGWSAGTDVEFMHQDWGNSFLISNIGTGFGDVVACRSSVSSDAAIANVFATSPGSRTITRFSVNVPITVRTSGYIGYDTEAWIAIQELSSEGWKTLSANPSPRRIACNWNELVELVPNRSYRLIGETMAFSCSASGRRSNWSQIIAGFYKVNLIGQVVPPGGQRSDYVEAIMADVYQNGRKIDWAGEFTLPGGKFGLLLRASGPCQVRLYTQTSLAKIYNIQLGDQAHSGIEFVPIEGDLDGDRIIGTSDLEILIEDFGLPRSEAHYSGCDLDRDGEIGPSDFAILSANFGMVGD